MTGDVDTHEHEPLEPFDPRPVLRLPATIEIMSQRYHVEVVDDPNEALGRVDHADASGALGLTELNRGRIRIRGGGEQSEDQVRDTLLHETLHVCAHLGGIDVDEEGIGVMATVLLHALRTNPELVAALISR